MPANRRVVVLPDPSTLAEAAARLVADLARAAVQERGRFTIALAGGVTPRMTYRRLAGLAGVPWEHMWVAFGDERCVTPDHPESNYRMARETLLDKVPIPPEHVLRIPGEREDADEAAADYVRRLAEVFGTRRGEVPRFDVILLGMGVDGHTASLFPGSPALRDVFRPVVAVHATAAALPRRITFTLPVLEAARTVIFLAEGAEKAKIVRAVLTGGATVPAAMVSPGDGELVWMLDQAAASMLPGERAPDG